MAELFIPTFPLQRIHIEAFLEYEINHTNSDTKIVEKFALGLTIKLLWHVGIFVAVKLYTIISFIGNVISLLFHFYQWYHLQEWN